MATGEWLSAPKGDLELDTTLSVVEEEGRPSFFRQEINSMKPKNKEPQGSATGVFTEDITGEQSTHQHSLHANDTFVGVRASKGSSTAETTESDSSQDTLLRKREAPTAESQPQNKGTRYPIPCQLPLGSY